jgi:SET domain-containing protein
MLVVPTELRASPIHGIGVFLLAPVKKGDLIWRFDSRIDRVYTREEIDSLPQIARDFVNIRAYLHKETRLWVLCGDNAKYYNHSKNPTALSVGRGFSDDIAAHDLPPDTEITSNYYEFYDNTDVLASMGLHE